DVDVGHGRIVNDLQKLVVGARHRGAKRDVDRALGSGRQGAAARPGWNAIVGLGIVVKSSKAEDIEGTGPRVGESHDLSRARCSDGSVWEAQGGGRYRQGARAPAVTTQRDDLSSG